VALFLKVMTRLEEILQHIETLEPFPRIVVQVLELISNDASAEELVNLIEQDAGITSKVLSLANSAGQGSQFEIDSIQAATTRLGLQAVGNLALTSGCSSRWTGYGGSSTDSQRGLWQESLHIALFARELATVDGRVDPELAYTVGLLQNIGHIVVNRFLRQEAAEIAQRMQEGMGLLAAERSVLGVDHAQCGALMVRQWGLPRGVIRGVQFHHGANNAGEDALLCSLCGLAEQLTVELLDPESQRPAYLWNAGELELEAPTGTQQTELVDRVRRRFLSIEG
jgi:HD-like signal output (HDOD) protein